MSSLVLRRCKSFQLHDYEAIYTDEANYLVIAHLPEIWCTSVVYVARENVKKAKKRLNRKYKIQNMNACTLAPARNGTVPASCGIPSPTSDKPTNTRNISMILAPGKHGEKTIPGKTVYVRVWRMQKEKKTIFNERKR